MGMNVKKESKVTISEYDLTLGDLRELVKATEGWDEFSKVSVKHNPGYIDPREPESGKPYDTIIVEEKL